MKVLVTGANGFVGQALCKRLADLGFSTVRAVRRGADKNEVEIGNIGPDTDWFKALEGVDAVLHLAARVHVMQGTARDSHELYRSVNVAGTRRLAEQSAARAVRRLVFVSSIKVNGECSDPGTPFSADADAHPVDAYGLSKLEAESALREVAGHSDLEVVIVRPPLVYGPGAKGNFAKLAALVRSGIPLPLASVDNRRALVGLDNLVDLLIRCIDHPAAPGQTFLVSDDEDLSTPELVRRLARAAGCPARLFRMPTKLLRTGGRLLGRKDEIERLVGTLQMDIRHTKNTLNWNPAVSVDEGLNRAMANS